MEGKLLIWVTWTLGALPLLWLLLKLWNEILYVLPVKLRCSRDGGKLPPGSLGIPFLGEMLSFLWYFKIIRRPDDFINNKRKKYGDGDGIYKTHLFGSPAIVACSPEAIKFMLHAVDDLHMVWPTVEAFGSTSLVAVQGKPYERIRRLVTNTARDPNALRRIAIQVQPRLVAGIESWAEKGQLLVYHEARKVIFENVGRLFASLDPGPLLDETKLLFSGVIKGVRANPINFPGTAYYHALQCKKRLDDIFGAELQKKKNRRECDEAKYDMMDGLMTIRDEEGNKLSDQEIIDNIIGLVLAGFESTSIASMWAIYYLAKFPDVLKKLREENIALSKKTNGEFITSEDVQSLKYTSKVVEETIRMANIAAFVFRKITKDIEYKGYRFPKGWNAIMWLRYLHTNPQHFDDPMSFNPDRWDEPAKPGTYQVFGSGPRMCAGNMLARIQIAILIHHLTIGYKWELVNPKAELVYLPHPRLSDYLEVTFSKL